MHVPFRLSLLIPLLLALAACGPARLENSKLKDVEPSHTGGEEQEHPYTAYGPVPELETVKKNVPMTEASKEFAGNIESAFLMSHHGRTESVPALRIQIKWKELEQPLEFWGELKPSGKNYVATLRDESDQKKGFVIVATCSNSECDTASAYLYNDRALKSAMIFRKESRLVQAHVDATTQKIILCYDQKIQELTSKYIKGVNMIVASTEIIPGRTHFKLYSGEPGTGPSQIEGSILQTDGDCTPLKGEGESIFANVCLAGNDGAGTLVIRAALPSPLPAGCNLESEVKTEPAIYIEMGRVEPKTTPANQPAVNTPQTPANQPVVNAKPITANQPVVNAQPAGKNAPAPTAKNVSPTPVSTAPSSSNPYCTFPIPIEKVHPLVRIIFQDCGHPIVVAKMAEILKPNGGKHRSHLIDFLARADNSRRGQTDQKTSQYTTVKNTLKANGKPAIFGLIVVKESNFNCSARSPAGALGCWQFKPDTFEGLGFVRNKIYDLYESTKAAAQYLEELLTGRTQRDTHEVNIKMALASWNWGLGKVNKKISEGKQRIIQGKNAGEARFVHLTPDQINQYSNDFWELYRIGMITDETSDFVISLYAMMFAGVHPEQVGLTNSPRFLDLD